MGKRIGDRSVPRQNDGAGVAPRSGRLVLVGWVRSEYNSHRTKGCCVQPARLPDSRKTTSLLEVGVEAQQTAICLPASGHGRRSHPPRRDCTWHASYNLHSVCSRSMEASW